MEVHMGKKKRKKGGAGGRIFSMVLFLVSLAVFCFAGYKLYTIYHEYNQGDDTYDSLQAYVIETDDDKKEEDEKEAAFSVDFEELLKQNKDLVGWIRIEEPLNISYPVMQSEDNDYYLRRLFDKSYNILGSIFMDYNCNADLTDDNTIIYGHNTKNGSMFGGLKKWKDKEEYDKNPYFYLYTPDGLCHQYQVCAVTVTDSRASDYKLDFEDNEAFTAWEKEIQEKSLYDTGVELDENSQIVTLSTCTNRVDSERLIVHGVEIQVRESDK